MKPPGSVSLAIAIVALSAAPALSAEGKDVEKEAKKELTQLSFMAGCWRGDLGDGTIIEEHYTEPTVDVMLGTSLLLSAKGGPTNSSPESKGEGRNLQGAERATLPVKFFEVIVVTRSAEGISLAPYPMGKPSVAFKLVRLEGRKAVFENMAHDFPQVIVYESSGEGALTARIEGLEDGRPKKAAFPMKAVPCTGR